MLSRPTASRRKSLEHHSQACLANFHCDRFGEVICHSWQGLERFCQHWSQRRARGLVERGGGSFFFFFFSLITTTIDMEQHQSGLYDGLFFFGGERGWS